MKYKSNLLKKLSESPAIFLNTFDTFWVILLSITANYFISLEWHYRWEISWPKVFKLLSLALCIIFFAIPYFSFKRNYILADEKDKRNLFDYEQGKTEKRHRIDFFLWKSFNKKKLLFLFVSVASLIYFMFNSEV